MAANHRCEFVMLATTKRFKLSCQPCVKNRVYQWLLKTIIRSGQKEIKNASTKNSAI